MTDLLRLKAFDEEYFSRWKHSIRFVLDIAKYFANKKIWNINEGHDVWISYGLIDKNWRLVAFEKVWKNDILRIYDTKTKKTIAEINFYKFQNDLLDFVEYTQTKGNLTEGRLMID